MGKIKMIKFEGNKLSESYALSKIIINGVLGAVASYFRWERLFSNSALILLLPLVGIIACFVVFRFFLGLKGSRPIKQLLLSGTFSSWAFFLVTWIIIRSF